MKSYTGKSIDIPQCPHCIKGEYNLCGHKTFDSVSTPKEEEIRDEFARFVTLSDEITNVIKAEDIIKIADYILKIRREAIAEEREKFINFILSEEIEMQVGDNINELLEYRGIADCGKSMRAGTKDKILQPLANRIKRNFSHLTQE